MATPNQKLAASLAQLQKAQGRGRRVFRSGELTRVHRQRLVRNGFLREVMKGWVPKPDGAPIRVVRFTESLLAEGVETRMIEGVSVKVFDIAKTVADCFRHRNKVGLSVAIEGFQETLRDSGQ